MNMIGQTISHYRILEKLGIGGMGSVYKAKDLNLDRFVALKFLNRDLLSDEESRQRFKNEAKVISTIEHPNIAAVYEIDEINDSFFISMGYYEGKTLRELLSSGCLSISKIYSIGIQIALGLTEAHNAGIIHRDIKPGNIIITEKSQVKILDFGLAKALNYSDITKQDVIMGTAAYMSPEQIIGETVDHRTDIFSFGILLYEMITGENPFKAEYSAALFYSILNEDPTPPHQLRSEIPEQLETVVIKALSKNVEDRYQSTAEMATDLKAVQGNEHVIPTVSKSHYRFSLSNRSVAILGSILALAALIISLFFIVRPYKSTHKTIASIAVMPFSYEGEEDWNWLGRALTDLLNTDLAQDPSLRVLGSQEVMKIMKSLNLHDSNINMSQALQVARKAKAESVLIGSLLKTGDVVRAQAQAFNTDDGALIADLEPIAGKPSNLYDMADELTSRMVNILNIDSDKKITSAKVATQMPSTLDALRYYIEGKDAALDLRYEEGIAKLNKAISLDSTFIKPYYFLAWAYSSIRDDTKAKEVLTRGKPYISHLSLEERLIFLKEEANLDRRWKDYSTYLEQLLQITPYKAGLHYSYGKTQFNHFRNIDAGVAAMQKSLQLDSTYSSAYNTLGYAYLSKGDKKKALGMIEKYITQKSAGVNPLDSKAEILTYVGRYEEAITLCQRIMALDPNFRDAPLRLTRALIAIGKYSRAHKILNENQQQSTPFMYMSIGRTLRALIYFLQDDLDKANKAVEEAIALDSINLEAHWLRGRILLHLKDKTTFNAQLEALKRVLFQKNSLRDRWFLHHLQGEWALQVHDFDKAIESFQKALDLAPLDRSFYLAAQANAYEQSGHLNNALVQYNLALEFNPNNAIANFGSARTYEKSGKISKASNAYNKVLKIWSGADKGIKQLEISKKKLAAFKISSKK